MSTGLELIPFAIMGILSIAKMMQSELKKAETTGILSIDTRMTDKNLVLSSLLALGYQVSEMGESLEVRTEVGKFQLMPNQLGVFVATCDNKLEFHGVSENLIAFEHEYAKQLQISIINEITANATKLGYEVSRDQLPNQSVRLSVKVSS